jgi:hypothetical protein
MTPQHHEIEVTPSTLRGFGITFAIALFLICWFWIGNPNNWSNYPSGLILLLALALPNALDPLFKFWLWFGSKIAIVNITIILGMSYFLIFTPLSLWFKIIGRDRLNRKWHEGSYWEAYDAHPFTIERYRKLF